MGVGLHGEPALGHGQAAWTPSAAAWLLQGSRYDTSSSSFLPGGVPEVDSPQGPSPELERRAKFRARKPSRCLGSRHLHLRERKAAPQGLRDWRLSSQGHLGSLRRGRVRGTSGSGTQTLRVTEGGRRLLSVLGTHVHSGRHQRDQRALRGSPAACPSKASGRSSPKAGHLLDTVAPPPWPNAPWGMLGQARAPHSQVGLSGGKLEGKANSAEQEMLGDVKESHFWG